MIDCIQLCLEASVCPSVCPLACIKGQLLSSVTGAMHTHWYGDAEEIDFIQWFTDSSWELTRYSFCKGIGISESMVLILVWSQS